MASRNGRGWVLLLVAVLGMGLVGPATAQRFLPDDPLWKDPDRMDMSFPKSKQGPERGPFEFLVHTFGSPSDYTGPALNVNTVGGVPNSSWYTNRHYRSPLSEAELRRGPNEEPGPSMQAPWRVVRLIERADLPRAVVRDASGRRFTLLFDAPAHPEMATGAAMIGSRLLYALGYNVPHHWLRSIRKDRLTPAADDSLSRTDVDSLLARAHQRPDSTFRVLVTRIPGVERRIGPFAFHGTRSDDNNDVFPHETRRELRGLKVFAAWLNYSNINRRHTLDVGVRENGRRFVRHYLTDLHLTLGSGGATRAPRWAGHEHLFELGTMVRRIGTLGLSGGEWNESAPPKWPAVGRFSADPFVPREWRPRWPNPAFQRCDAADAFWAAKQIRHFSRSELEAIVSTAGYTSQQAEAYVLETLLQRRNAIGEAYLHWGGGLGRFAVQNGQLTFQDFRDTYDLAPDSLRRTITWHVYDNQEEQVEAELRRRTSARESIPLPPSRAAFLRATLTTPEVGTTHVSLRRGTMPGTPPPQYPVRYEVVGVERSGTAPDEP